MRRLLLRLTELVLGSFFDSSLQILKLLLHEFLFGHQVFSHTSEPGDSLIDRRLKCLLFLDFLRVKEIINKELPAIKLGSEPIPVEIDVGISARRQKGYRR